MGAPVRGPNVLRAAPPRQRVHRVPCPAERGSVSRPGRYLGVMRGFFLLLLGLAVAGASLALARFPGVVERVYGQALGPWIARTLSVLTGWSPVSLSFVGIIALASWAVWRGAAGIGRIRAGEIGTFLALQKGAAWTAGVVGVLILAFYLLWGLNYARAPLDERLELVREVPPDPEELGRFAEYVVERTNLAYRTLHGGEEDIGAPTVDPLVPRQLSDELSVGWRRVGEALGMGSLADRSYGPVKIRGTSWVLDGLDLLGVYSPFTGEAHVTGSPPAVVVPASVGHEQAHQRAIPRENEATFAGALAAIHSDGHLVRYSGWARILRSVMRDLARADRPGRDALMERVHPGVRRDWADYARWYQENRSVAGPVASAVNDTYLRTHAVPGGIQSYSRDTTLFLEWWRRYGGRLTVLPGTSSVE